VVDGFNNFSAVRRSLSQSGIDVVDPSIWEQSHRPGNLRFWLDASASVAGNAGNAGTKLIFPVPYYTQT